MTTLRKAPAAAWPALLPGSVRAATILCKPYPSLGHRGSRGRYDWAVRWMVLLSSALFATPGMATLSVLFFLVQLLSLLIMGAILAAWM